MNDRRLVIAVFIVGLLLGAIVGIVYSMYSGRYIQPPSPSSENMLGYLCQVVF